ncbi:MAG: helix-turn-helix transcriptional regulator [Gammaproteobacteria bacterium]|nr:helix-turn-helix transcriptional regulator [Gammaproteobacteria bacterium]MDH5730483.1 helix-turn-helix transcriptional regulator [Gammaproteobacteria bacterium]
MAFLLYFGAHNEYLVNSFFTGLNCSHLHFSSIADCPCDEFAKARLVLYHLKSPNDNVLCQLKSLKQRHSAVPIVVTAEQKDDQITTWALRARMWDLILLPAEFNYLKQKLHFLLHETTFENRGGRDVVFPCQRQQAALRPDRQYDRSKKTFKAIQYMDDFFASKVRLGDLAGMCNMSPSAFSNTFKRENGITFSQYLQNHRIDTAKELLKIKHNSVAEVAYACGYDDVSYFIRVFRNDVGQTPTDFRNHIDLGNGFKRLEKA